MQQHSVVQGSCMSLASCLGSQLSPAGLVWLDGIWTLTGLVSPCHLASPSCFYSDNLGSVHTGCADQPSISLSLLQAHCCNLRNLPAEQSAWLVPSSHLLGTMTVMDLQDSPFSTSLWFSLPIWLLLSLARSTPCQGQCCFFRHKMGLHNFYIGWLLCCPSPFLYSSFLCQYLVIHG